MTNKELQTYLAQFPDDLPVKIVVDHQKAMFESGVELHDMDAERILHTSVTAYVDDSAPEEEWDTEDGKVMLGSGQRILVFNPIIL